MPPATLEAYLNEGAAINKINGGGSDGKTQSGQQTKRVVSARRAPKNIKG